MSKIFILHGWSYSTEKWDSILRLLEQNNIDFELLKIPGLTAPLKEVWDLSDYVSWLNREIGSAKTKVVLLGHSNGGRIAAAYTAKFPQKVACLIIIDSAGLVKKDVKTLIKKNILKLVSNAGKKIVKSDKGRNLMYKFIGERDYNDANPIVKKTMVNLISQDLSETFSDIIVPTLIIWGKNDSVTPLNDGKKINKLIKGSEFFVVDAKHSPQFTNVETVFQKVFTFVKHYGNF